MLETGIAPAMCILMIKVVMLVCVIQLIRPGELTFTKTYIQWNHDIVLIFPGVRFLI